VSESSNQQSGYISEVVEEKPGYIIWKIILTRGAHHFCVSPLVRVDPQNRGILRQMEIAQSLEQARQVGQKFKEAAIEDGYAVE
jgi:hypothetical protein